MSILREVYLQDADKVKGLKAEIDCGSQEMIE
jgi:hypothetical protein